SELACVIAAVLLAHASTWYHHYAMLPIAMALLWTRDEAPSTFHRAALVLAYALVQVFGVAWHRFEGHALAVESATIGALILWTTAAACLRSRPAALTRPGAP